MPETNVAQRSIVVGVDDSEGAVLAVQWAAETARRYAAPLRIVAAFRWLLPYWWGGAMYANARDLDVTKRVAEDLVERLVTAARADFPDLSVDGAALEGDPVAVLERESAAAAMVVIGSRRLGGLGSAVLGSVGVGISARSSCPAVVLRGPAGDPAEGAGVVVGVDGGEESADVLGFGFEYAARNELPLRAVLCWRPDALSWGQRDDQPFAREQAEAWLEASLIAGWQERYPQVKTRSLVLREQPVPGLLSESTGQQLLVVGSRGRGVMRGALLGSVSQGVLHHATCPVAIVPTHEGRSGL